MMTTESVYYDRQGNLISLDEWVRLWHVPGYRKVARTYGEGYAVSTVWLGLDHSGNDGPVAIFESLVLEGWLTDKMVRYSTEAEAVAGHKRLVQECKEAVAKGRDGRVMP